MSNLYISKSWSVAFIVSTLQLSHISVHLIIIFFPNFPIIVFNIYFLFYFNIYTFSNLSPPLHFLLPTTLYINIILLLSLHLPLVCLFSFTLSYYKFVTIYSILCMVFFHKKKGSLSLSLSLSQFFDEFFIHSSIYAKLLIFGIFFCTLESLCPFSHLI